jgi:hypothetical protein
MPAPRSVSSIATFQAARHRLRDLLSVNGRLRPDLEPVFHALLQQPGTSLLAWLTRRPARHSVLRALATGTGPVTYDILDGLRPTKMVDNLRMHLVAGGALPMRDERLASLERWLPGMTAQVRAAESRKVLHAYITWHLLRRLRNASRRRSITHGQAHGARAYVTQVVRLLDWLDDQNIALSTCPQDLLDAWLDDNPARGPRVHGFLAWANRKGYTRHLTVQLETPTFTGHLIAQDTRWGLVNRLIHDAEIPVADKTAGLLALLFAQEPYRITALTTNHTTISRNSVVLRLGKIPAEMPHPGRIRPRPSRRSDGHEHGRGAPAPSWSLPGQHLSRSRLTSRLQALGIRPRMARNTALVEPASELPAVVVSRLLGIHQNTADAWRRIGGQDGSYAAELACR